MQSRQATPGPLRWCGEHQHLTAALFFGLLVLAYLWPVLIGGKILSPISLLYYYTPWNGQAPSDVHGYFNELLTDVPQADYPWRFFARELLHQGTLPAWNPHVFAGSPFLSNPQTGIYSPFSLPLWILPLNYGIGVGAALKLWAGGFGTYLLVRQLRLGMLPGLLAGTCFAFSSLNITWLTHETLPAVAVLLPWMIWLVERIFERGRLGDMLGLALATAISIGGGHPGTQLHVMVATGCYVLLRIAFRRSEDRPDRLRALGLAGGGLALGTLLMGVMLIPELLSSHGTIGTLARQGGGALPGTDMPFGAVKSVLFPDWWGRPGALQAINPPTKPTVDNIVNYSERTFYVGVVAVLLAAVGLVSREGWRRKAPFAALAALGLAIPVHTPGLYQLVEHLPGLELVQNQRLHFVFAFGTAVLAAFGLQAVLDRPEGERGRAAALLAAVAVGLVAFVAIGPSGRDVEHLATHFLTGRDFHSNAVLALTSVAWFLLFTLAAGAALLAAHRWPRHRGALAAIVVLLAAADMLHFAHGYQPMGPASKVIPPRTPSIAFLQRHAREGRIFGLGATLPNSWGIVYGLDDVRGYDPPQPTVRFYRLWKAVTPKQTEWQPFRIDTLTPPAAQVIGVLGARYMITDPGMEVPKGERDPALLALRPVYRGSDATVFVNERAAPRTMVASAVTLVDDEAATRAAIVRTGFDPSRSVVVERGEPGAVALAGAGGARGTVRVSDEQNAQVTLQASLERRGLVVLNDQLTEGWSVRVDGRRAQALHVNDVMRGVAVGAGRHTIVWSYRVPGLRLGVLLSGLSALLLLGGVATLTNRRRRTTA